MTPVTQPPLADIASTRTPLLAAALVALLGMLFLGGCVNQSEFDRLTETNRSLTEANERLRQERDEARAALDVLRGNLARAEQALQALQGQYGDATGQLDAALRALRDMEGRFGDINFAPLDAQTDAALRALADQFPNLITYDAARGMLRFASDLTFDSGSAVVRENAREALNALGQILTSQAAQGYEVHVVGHTDSQRISANTARLHPTNTHLSAHRAIAVRDALRQMNVRPEKMMVAGWGEFRPAVPNNPGGNTPQNRRVEIFLTKSTLGAGAPVGTDAGAPVGAPGSGGSRSVAPDRQAPPARASDIVK